MRRKATLHHKTHLEFTPSIITLVPLEPPRPRGRGLQLAREAARVVVVSVEHTLKNILSSTAVCHPAIHSWSVHSFIISYAKVTLRCERSFQVSIQFNFLEFKVWCLLGL